MKLFFKTISNQLIIAGLFLCSCAASNSPIPVAVIGSGCGGLSAAMVTTEYGFPTTVFSGPIQGGDLNAKTRVGNWPGVEPSMGNEIITNLEKQARRFGAEFVPESIKSVDFSKKPFELKSSSGKTYQALKVVIATGTTDRMLSVPGANENRSKILYNWDIHKNMQDFMSSCQGKNVAIIGGGVDAVKKASYAKKGGANDIKIFIRGKDLKVAPWRKRFMKRENSLISIQPFSELSQIQDIDGKARLSFKDNQTQTYDADIIIVSIGRIPRSDLFKKDVKTDDKGFIVINAKTQETNVPGVYACGDVTDAAGPQPQAGIAAGNGMIAGYTIIEELMKEQYPQQAFAPSFSERNFQKKENRFRRRG